MNTINDGACKWCEEKAVRKQGRIWLCEKHYRFQQMRINSSRRGKTTPEYADPATRDMRECLMMIFTCFRKITDGAQDVMKLYRYRFLAVIGPDLLERRHIAKNVHHK